MQVKPFFMDDPEVGRIRTVKPELLKHEGLFELEQETGLPIRIAFVGLFTVCDREGRFKWRPRTIKLDVLPYDDCDFSRVLDALATRGMIRQYRVGDEIYGIIPTFPKHQVINNRETESELPKPEDSQYIQWDGTSERREEHASGTRGVPVEDAPSGEGKGREGKGIGKEEEGKESHAADASPGKSTAQKKAEPGTGKVWAAYATAYWNRYGVEPVRNATVNSQLSQLVRRLGADDAEHVAGFYLTHRNRFYVEKMHSVGPMLADCEKLRTEWATSSQMTSTRAAQEDRTQTNYDAFAPLIAEAQARERG